MCALISQKEHEDLSSEVSCLRREYVWLLRSQATVLFDQLDQLLRDCCRTLPLPSKMAGFLRIAPNMGLQPEKLTLAGRSNDAVRCNLTVLGDNIVQAEVAVRYAKWPGGVFRSVAQPDVQWKLQQVQDVANHVVKALELLSQAQHQIKVDSSAGQVTPEDMCRMIDQLVFNIQSARADLLTPRKRSLLELQEYRPNKCFNPALPADLLLSFYVSGNKLVCAAYHLQTSTSSTSKQTFHVYQGECVVQWLSDVLSILSCALQLAQQMKDKLIIFADCKDLQIADRPSPARDLSADELLLKF